MAIDRKASGDEFLASIAEYLNLPSDQVTKENVLNAMVGPAPDKDALRGEYSPILESFQKQTQGYTAAEKEAMTSQTRQQLADQARSVGAGQRMLSGRSKAMAATMAQAQAVSKQAGVVQDVAAKEKAYKRSGEEGLADLEQQIAIASQTRMDAYNKRRADVALNMEQVMELKRQKDAANESNWKDLGFTYDPTTGQRL